MALSCGHFLCGCPFLWLWAENLTDDETGDDLSWSPRCCCWCCAWAYLGRSRHTDDSSQGADGAGDTTLSLAIGICVHAPGQANYVRRLCSTATHCQLGCTQSIASYDTSAGGHAASFADPLGNRNEFCEDGKGSAETPGGDVAMPLADFEARAGSGVSDQGGESEQGEGWGEIASGQV